MSEAVYKLTNVREREREMRFCFFFSFQFQYQFQALNKLVPNNKTEKKNYFTSYASSFERKQYINIEIGMGE
jgi:hypothetical protein